MVQKSLLDYLESIPDPRNQANARISCQRLFNLTSA